MKLLIGPKEIVKKPEILLIENWYSKEEEERVWKELDYYTNKDKFEGAIESGNVATEKDGSFKGDHFRVHLDQIYTPKGRSLSDILKYHSKIQQPQFHNLIKEVSPEYSRTFMTTNITYSLISYYENSHYYKAHHDAFFWTILIWFFKEPKIYKGGNLIFKEFDQTINCKHNMLCAFPSYYLHEVVPIEIPEENQNKGLGRYTITHFLHYVENHHLK